MLKIFNALLPYFGGKRKLCPVMFGHIAKHLPREQWQGKIFVDIFSGSAAVSLFAKVQGFRVISNDISERGYIAARALIESNSTFLTDADVGLLSIPNQDNNHFIEENFVPAVFAKRHARFLDSAFTLAKTPLQKYLLLKYIFHIRPCSKFSSPNAFNRPFEEGEFDQIKKTYNRSIENNLKSPYTILKLTDTENHDVAEEMFNALHSRIKNRFGNKGLLVMISSPRYIDDFIEKKMKEAKINPNIFAKRKMLWESKPARYFTKGWIDFEGYKIPLEFETEARRNPEAFKRDYMAIPCLALEPYFKQFELVEQCIDTKLEHPIDERGKLKTTFKRRSGNWHYIHVDLSHKRDATGIAMVHAEEDVIVVDLMRRIKPPPGGQIFFADIRDLIFEIRNRGFEIYYVTFDGWQSIDSIQILKEKGFRCEVLSVDKDTAAYDTLQEKIHTKKFKFYRYGPFLEEIRILEFIEGKKVDHPPTGSKDVTDAVAGATYMCVSNPNNVDFWFGGDLRKHKTQKELLKEAETLRLDGLGPYGYIHGRRG